MVILKGGTVFPVSGKPFSGDIAFENGKITALSENLDIPGAEIVDVSGKYVIPGLVDPHSHIGLQESGSREVDHNEKGRPITPEMRAIDAINPADETFADARALGITTVVTGPGSINLLGGTFAALKTVGNTVEKMLLRDNIAMKMALGENPKFRYTELKKEPYSRMGSAYFIREALYKAKSYSEKKKKGTLSEIDLGMEALSKVIEGTMPMKIHCHRSDDIMTAVRIMREFDLRYTLDHCTEGYMIPDDIKAALSEKCEGIIIGPIISFKRKLESKNKLRTTFGAKLYEQGIPYAMCTDFPDSALECLTFAAALCVTNGVPEDKALESITLAGAKACGIADRVGSLEVGKDADIAVFSGDPFNSLNVCERTYIDGQLVYNR